MQRCLHIIIIDNFFQLYTQLNKVLLNSNSKVLWPVHRNVMSSFECLCRIFNGLNSVHFVNNIVNISLLACIYSWFENGCQFETDFLKVKQTIDLEFWLDCKTHWSSIMIKIVCEENNYVLQLLFNPQQ